ncbi:MAG: TRAP transporter substrate-binding protein [Calothrix sp. SM1_5_4]|nr:TRAP transporter substrate-binding protein [Calothrix sp. SM1_5_4]
MIGVFAKGQGEAPKYPTPEKPLVLKGGLVPPPHAPQTKSCILWSDYVKKATNGAVMIEVYPAEQLGVERVLLEGTNLGTIDWTYVGPGGAERLTPELRHVRCAYAIQGKKHLRNSLFNQEFVNYMDQVISKNSSVNFLGFGWVGSRHAIFDKPVRTPEEGAGLKMRVPDVPMYKIAAQAMGCTPTPISYGESYMAMSQGVVDGAEGPYQGIHDVKWYEVRKVVTETAHVESLGAIFMHKNSMAKMSPDQQKIIRDNAFKAMVDSFEIALKQDDEYKQKLVKFGVQFIPLTDDQKAVFVKRAQALLEKEYIPKWGEAWKVFSDLAKK